MAYLILREDKVAKTTDLYGNVVTDNDDSYTLYIQSDTGVFANVDSSSLFDSFYNLKNIANMQYFDTSYTTNMRVMFNDCLSIKTIDVSNFDTSKVTNMSNMFRAGNGFSAIDRELS